MPRYMQQLFQNIPVTRWSAVWPIFAFPDPNMAIDPFPSNGAASTICQESTTSVPIWKSALLAVYLRFSN